MKIKLLASLLGLVCVAHAQVSTYQPPSIQSITQIAPAGGSAGAFLRYQVTLAHGTDPKPMLTFPIYSGPLPASVESSVGYDSSYSDMDVVVSVKATSVIGAYKLDDFTILHSGGQTVYKRDGTIQHLFYPAAGLPKTHSLNFALGDFSVVAPGGTLPDPAGGTEIKSAAIYPINMSVRVTPSQSQPLIIGFVISAPVDGGAGSGKARVLVRAVGPGLTQFGVGGEMPDPKLTVNSSPAVTVDNWSDDPANAAACREVAGKTGAFPLAEGSRDAAVVVNVSPGDLLTVSVENAGTVGGEVLVEVYRVP